MKSIEFIDELLQQQKKSKLNNEKKNKAYELLSGYIRSGDNKDKYKYIIDFNSDIGIAAFVDYLNSLSVEEKLLEVQSLFTYKGFEENISYKSTRRGLDLLVQIHNKNFEKELIIDTLVKTCDTTLDTSKNTVNKTIIEAMRRTFFPLINDTFYETNFSISQDSFYKIERLFINSAFNDDITELKVTSKTKILVLKWLSKFAFGSGLNNNDKEYLEKFVSYSEKEFIEILKEDNEFMNKYGSYIDKNIDHKEIDEDKEFYDKRDEHKNLIALSFKDIVANLEEISFSIKILEKENNRTSKNLKYYLNEYEKIKNERDSLYNELKHLREYVKEVNQKNDFLAKEVEKLKEIDKMKSEEIGKYKENIFELLNTKSNVDNIELKQFKNKLKNLLSKDLMEIKDLSNEEPNSEVFRFIGLKIQNIARILKNNDIDV